MDTHAERSIPRLSRAVLYGHVPAGIGARGYAGTSGVVVRHGMLEGGLVRAIYRPCTQVRSSMHVPREVAE